MSKIFVDEIASKTGGATGLTIDSSGHVFRPQTPAFFVHRNASYTLSAGEVMQFNTAEIDTDNGFDASTHSYTIPVTGLWHFSGALSFTGVTSGRTYIGIIFRVNGSDYHDLYDNYNYNSGSAYGNIALTTMRQCTAGEKIDLYMSASGSGILFNHDVKRSHMMGRLIG